MLTHPSAEGSHSSRGPGHLEHFGMGLCPGISVMWLLLLLLGQGTTQIHASPGQTTWVGQRRPKLQTLKNFPFLCNPKTLEFNMPSKSVHSLRPSDIKLVAAIGNLETPPDSEMVDLDKPERTENKPQQTCMRVMTDIIRHFNPAVLMPTCPPERSVVLHSDAEDLWNQAKELVRSLKENPQLDFQHDWKLINVFFSNASQCYLCPSVQQKRHLLWRMDRLAGTLEYLRQEVPKAFVNLVDLPEDVAIPRWHQGTELSGATPEPCSCSGETSTLAKAVGQWSYQEAWESLLASSDISDQESFTVVFQPFFYELLLPSEKLPPQDPTILAISLWNSMMERAGHKDEPFGATERRRARCPSPESPYLFTYKNSNYQARLLKAQRKAENTKGLHIRCPRRTPSDTVPTSVHRLKLADIKVVGALGDSLTAGNGAGSRVGDLADVRTEYRGLSWSIGGDQDLSTVITLPNLLREYNHNLKGFSVGTGKANTPGAFFNQAVAEAQSSGLTAQAQRLVNLMKTDDRINFENDWKLITVFIGGSDLCHACNDPAQYSPQNFTNNIRRALDILHAEVPRAFVNMVNVPDIVVMRWLFKSDADGCPQVILRTLCPCVMQYRDESAELASLIKLNKKYQEGTEELIASGRYDTRDDFTVVLQPFLEHVPMPKNLEGVPDSTFFAPDCFHFSAKFHNHAATGLWRNMLEPVGQKTRQHDFQVEPFVMCPDQAQPFLMTNQNSREEHGSRLTCSLTTPSEPRPTSVHALRPGDIGIVAALGDSVTAGNGIGTEPGNFFDVTTQYRGLSFSIGGDESLQVVTTLPNIIRRFNSQLTGYSTGTSTGMTNAANDPSAFLNRGAPGAKSEDLPGQVQTLIQMMKTDSRINFEQHWKLITVMIGTNDLCDFCIDSNQYSAANYFDNLRNALDTLYREVPKAMVNLVHLMNPSLLRQVFLGNPENCPTDQASLMCNCILTPRNNSNEVARLEALTRAFQSSLQELVESGRYDKKKDFTVVLQPFSRTILLPVLSDGRPDMSFFAPDCIHPNRKFHAQLARALWTNMLEPVGRKTETLDLAATLSLPCPTQESPFLRTFQNSNYKYPTIENWGSDFLCPGQKPSNSIPTSVHRLQPADIKVVAALGDSLTIAMGAQPGNSRDQSTPWRGLSWSIGGDRELETHTTLPNILKKFNPSILGFSTGTSEQTAGLNVAVGGARARDMPGQARELVKRMKSNAEISLEKDWKLITLFIGGSDLCHYCENPKSYSTKEALQHIQEALDILSKELRRAFVNVVMVMELVSLQQGQGEKCAMPLAAQKSCSCIRHSQNSQAMQDLKKMNRELQSGMSSFSYQYTQHEDFAVVVQPFPQNVFVPLNKRGSTDLRFFSEDCFYFSEGGHAEMAIALWNNMLEPVGQKTILINFNYSRTKLTCPSPGSPFLYTLQNSHGLLTTMPKKISLVHPWAVSLALICGLLIGVLLAMIGWIAARHHHVEAPSGKLKTKVTAPMGGS